MLVVVVIPEHIFNSLINYLREDKMFMRAVIMMTMVTFVVVIPEHISNIVLK